VNLLLFSLTIILFFISKPLKENFNNLNHKEHPFYFFYPISYFFLIHTPLKKILTKNKKRMETLKSLYIDENLEEKNLLHWCSKLSLVLLIILIFNGISFGMVLKGDKNAMLISNQYLERPDFGEGSEEVNLDAVIEDNHSNYRQSITIDVEERQYQTEEMRKKVTEVKKYIDVQILGENTSRDNITKPLHLVRGMPGTSFKIKWDLGTGDYIESNGTIHNETVKESGQLVTITAIIHYGKMQIQYPVSLRIAPKVISRQEQYFKQLNQYIQEIQKESLTKKQITLPEKVNNFKVRFIEPKENNVAIIFLFGILIALLMGYSMDYNLEKRMKKRELELLMDYPEIMNKFTLLLGAGMTIKNAWGRIAGEYNNKLEQKKGEKRYAYEELLVTWYELTNGVPEVTAFDNFGKRVKLMPYLKFSSLISQNLKKGSKGLLDLLEYESIEAFEERKELAKRLGEEAGTKLLGPMMIMLVIVLFIIVIPAFMSF
jgi:Flp pilus assembly protein TadC